MVKMGGGGMTAFIYTYFTLKILLKEIGKRNQNVCRKAKL